MNLLESLALMARDRRAFKKALDFDFRVNNLYSTTRFHSKTDPIHLGSHGIFILSRLFANKVFGCPVDGRLFSDIVRSTSRHPRTSQSCV